MTTVDTRYPIAIQEIWIALRAEVVWLHGRWIIYRQLFGTSPEQIDILNRSAATFFYIIQRLLLNDVPLSLSKLGDPAGNENRKNLTLNALIEKLESIGECVLCTKLKQLMIDFDSNCTKLRHRRNKLIAHLDQETVLNQKVKPLEGPSRAEIEDAFEALRKVMNHVESYYTGSQTVYEQFIMDSDGIHLISKLKQGLRYQELVHKGVIAFNDLDSSFK